MRARAVIEAVHSPASGRTRYPTLRSDPPLTLRSTPDGVHLVGTSAGPLTGDDLGLTIMVGAGANLTVRSVAASLIQPGVVDRPSTFAIDVTVAAGATLYWLPQPAVLVRGCDHETVVRIHLAEDATLIWRDEVVLGRHDEPCGSLRQQLIVDVGDQPLLRNELVVGPRWPGSLGPAGTDGARAVGSLVLAGLTATDTTRNCRAERASGARSPTISGEVGRAAGGAVRVATLPLDGPGVLVTALADRPADLARALDEMVANSARPTVVTRPTGDRAA